MASEHVDRAEAPVSIYFGLTEGEAASLEVIAEAAIAYVGAIREMAHAIDPTLEVSVDIIDGDRSSLWLNTLTAIEQKLDLLHQGGEKYPRLWALAKGLAIIVVATPLSVTAEDVWRDIANDDPAIVARLSDDDRKALIDDLKKALREDVARPQKKQFFRSAEKDTTIKEVGVAAKPKGKPRTLVPRERFTSYLNPNASDEVTDSFRKRSETWEVTLISPVLENSERSWRFIRGGMPEFGAVMRDKGFLDAIESGGVHVELRKGIQMVLEIQFKERFEGGVWLTMERSVIRVIEPGYERGGLGF